MGKWNEKEITLLKELYDNNLGNKEIAEQLGKTPKAVRLFLNRKLGLNFSDQDKGLKEQIQCLNCQAEITVLKSENRRFCDKSCSASFNNKTPKRIKNAVLVNDEVVVAPNKCLHCDTELLKRNNLYCNTKCENDYKWNQKHNMIVAGKHLSHRTMKSYLIRLHGAVCMTEGCGWGERNQYTNTIPIELEHIDGNSDNNSLPNLKLLCPNCHSLTPTYKGANAGNGRAFRRERYAAGKSF